MATIKYAGTTYEISDLEAGAYKNVIHSIVTQSRTEWLPHIWETGSGERVVTYLLITTAVPIIIEMDDEDDAAAQLGLLMSRYAVPRP